MNEILKSNAKFLKQRFAKTFEQISACAEKVAGEIFENGTYVWQQNDVDLHPYGSINAIQLVGAWLKQISFNESTLYLVSGFGTGLHVEKLLEKIDANSAVVVVDLDLQWLKWLFSHRDCSGLLSDPRFLLLTDTQHFEVLSSLDLVYKNNICTCLFSPLFSVNESKYYQFFLEFYRNFDMQKKLQATVVGDSENWQHNAIKNLKFFVNAPSIDVLKGAFADLPLVLVSAGPSLDTAIPFLKAVQDRAIIVSMNSSFRTLFKNGIRSHLTLAIDPRPTTFEGFKGVPIDATVLLTSFFVHPDVVRHFNGQLMTWNESQLLSNYVYRKLGHALGPHLKAVGTVANLVGDLANFLGCKKVCLVGQDLACKQSGQTHVTDSIYNDSGSLFYETKFCRECPGNTQEKVFVEQKLYLYLQAFNKMADEYPSIEFINTSHFGAKIKNIPYVDYKEAVTWLGENDSRYVAPLLHRMLKDVRSVSESDLVDILRPIYKYVKRLSVLALRAAAWHDMHDEPKNEHARVVRDGYKWADEVNSFLDTEPQIYEILVDGNLIHSLFKHTNNVACLTNGFTEKCQKLWVENREYYWALWTGCNDFLVHLIDAYPELIANEN